MAKLSFGKLPALWYWGGYFNYLVLNFLIYKMRMKVIYTNISNNSNNYNVTPYVWHMISTIKL